MHVSIYACLASCFVSSLAHHTISEDFMSDTNFTTRRRAVDSFKEKLKLDRLI